MISNEILKVAKSLLAVSEVKQIDMVVKNKIIISVSATFNMDTWEMWEIQGFANWLEASRDRIAQSLRANYNAKTNTTGGITFYKNGSNIFAVIPLMAVFKNETIAKDVAEKLLMNEGYVKKIN